MTLYCKNAVGKHAKAIAMHTSENGEFKQANAVWVKNGGEFKQFFPTPQGTITLVISGGGGEYVISGTVLEATGAYSMPGVTVSISMTAGGSTSVVTVLTDEAGNYTYSHSTQTDFSTIASATIAGMLLVTSATIATEVIPVGAYIVEWTISHTLPSSWSGVIYRGFYMTNKSSLSDVISVTKNGAKYTIPNFTTSTLSDVAGMVNNDTGTTSGSLGFARVNRASASATNVIKMITYDNSVKFSYGTEVYPGSAAYNATNAAAAKLTILTRLGTNRTNLTAYMMGCTSLATVGAGAFSACTNMQVIAKMFQGCTALTSNVNSIFPDASYPNVTDLSQIFYGCTALTGSALSFIAKFPNAINTAGAFYNCTKLSDYASIPAAWK